VGEIGDPGQLTKIVNKTTFVIHTSFLLLDNRYLLVGFYNRYVEPGKPWKFVTSWHLYDIDSGKHLFTLGKDFYFTTQKKDAAKGNELYVYSPSGENNPEDCGGWIRVYSLN